MKIKDKEYCFYESKLDDHCIINEMCESRKCLDGKCVPNLQIMSFTDVMDYLNKMVGGPMICAVGYVNEKYWETVYPSQKDTIWKAFVHKCPSY